MKAAFTKTGHLTIRLRKIETMDPRCTPAGDPGVFDEQFDHDQVCD